MYLDGTKTEVKRSYAILQKKTSVYNIQNHWKRSDDLKVCQSCNGFITALSTMLCRSFRLLMKDSNLRFSLYVTTGNLLTHYHLSDLLLRLLLWEEIGSDWKKVCNHNEASSSYSTWTLSHVCLSSGLFDFLSFMVNVISNKLKIMVNAENFPPTTY